MPCAQRVCSAAQLYKFDPRAIYFLLVFVVNALGWVSRTKLKGNDYQSLSSQRDATASTSSAFLWFFYISIKHVVLLDEQITEIDTRSRSLIPEDSSISRYSDIHIPRDYNSSHQVAIRNKLIKALFLSVVCQVCVTAFQYKERESILDLSFFAMILAQELVKFLMIYAIEYYKPGGPSLNDLSYCSSFLRNPVGGEAVGHNTHLDNGEGSEQRLQGESGSDTPLPSDGCVLS